MATGHYAFRQLDFPQQCRVIWEEGTFLMRRYEEEDAVNLYHLPGGFFAEVYFDQFEGKVYRTNSFTSTDYFDGHYGCYLELPPFEF
ncbi:hypothetical protein [Hymenobacter latericus]|uniref:hypothetical protein n=1 Tax=Hymenobacter sp. YIM 151858-1 TaxID=2987688 RepID=UPI002225F227|nr:hypothetical protein [Hymenobacter sp. YIM 151858-1]UYZ61229.1 hypothetical protein OIS50_19865 [Hymenobacter sp. YIM 151858-1]